MNYQEVLKVAREKCTLCKVCPVCNGLACAGQIPGVGGKGNGSSFKRNYSKLREYGLLMDTISNVDKADCTCELFGRKVDLPVYAAPIAAIQLHFGAEIDDLDYTRDVFEGCKNANTIAFSGDGISLDVFMDPLSILNEYDNGICTIKPWIKEGIDVRMKAANASSAVAIASDIDAAGLPFLKQAPVPTEFKSKERLKEMVEESKKPFIVKGILSLEGARKAYEAGADGIIVSNHGGRVLEDCVSSIEVLEEIADTYKGKMTILVDGGFRSGADIFKALALGADGVLIGRPVTIAAIGGKAEGVKLYFDKIKAELLDCMEMCGCRTLSEITKSNLFKKEEN